MYRQWVFIKEAQRELWNIRNAGYVHLLFMVADDTKAESLQEMCSMGERQGLLKTIRGFETWRRLRGGSLW
jgi:hypothetical protein